MLNSQTLNALDSCLLLLDNIKQETIQEIIKYLTNRRIPFGNILDFLKNPNYPGNKLIGPQLIVERFLNLVISKHHVKIQRSKLPLIFVFKITFRSILKT